MHPGRPHDRLTHVATRTCQHSVTSVRLAKYAENHRSALKEAVCGRSPPHGNSTVTRAALDTSSVTDTNLEWSSRASTSSGMDR